jgi:O-antigen ligase
MNFSRETEAPNDEQVPRRAGNPQIALPQETLLRRAILVVAIGLSAMLGYFTTYVLQLLMLAVAALFLVRRDRTAIPFDLPAKLFFTSFSLLFVPALVTARQPSDLLQTLNFASMLLYAPLALMFGRAAHKRNSRKIADFALAGAAGALLLSLWFTYVEQLPRAGLGSFFTDPIRLSNTALIIGFFAMIGAVAADGYQRFVYFIGPVLALAVIFASGSRAALIAFGVLLFVAALLLVKRKRFAALVSIGLLAGFALMGYVTDVAGLRSSTLFEILGRLASGDDPADLGTAIRFILYHAGFAAFLDAPLFGHGWGRLMSSITPYLAPSDLVHAQLPHLHNDALNFGVASGGFGLAVYVLLLALPVVSCLTSPRDSQYRTRVYGGALLAISYFVLGLPDTMLSFPLHNTLYVVMTAMLLNYCRDPEQVAPAA